MFKMDMLEQLGSSQDGSMSSIPFQKSNEQVKNHKRFFNLRGLKFTKQQNRDRSEQSDQPPKPVDVVRRSHESSKEMQREIISEMLKD